MFDYLVIGLGLAGISFCETLERNNRSFVVIDGENPGASQVAGGLYNPVVLKRLNRAWKAQEQLSQVAPFYQGLEAKLQCRFHFPAPVLRRFQSPSEHNTWAEAADSPALRPFLNPVILKNTNLSLNAPNGYGEVWGTGRVDTSALIAAFASYLEKGGKLRRGHFKHDKLLQGKSWWEYGPLKARNVVLATGFSLSKDPMFGYLPLQGNKGEYLEIHAPALKETRVIKAAVFLIPLGEDRYLAGATYDWKRLEEGTTDRAKKYLTEKLDQLLICSYEITGQVAGIRPTVPDRRPLVGQHPEFSGLYILNGFGSRGVMIAPYAAQSLFESIEGGLPLDAEMDIARFQKRYIRTLPPWDRNG